MAAVHTLYHDNKPGVDTVRLILNEALTDLEKNPDFVPQKIMILLLDDRDLSDELAFYKTRYHTGGMKTSEGISLLEVMKIRFLEIMGYPSKE